MINKILIIAAALILSACASKNNSTIIAGRSNGALPPITIHYNGDHPPPVLFVKDQLPPLTTITPDYISYGDSYWWWRAH